MIKFSDDFEPVVLQPKICNLSVMFYNDSWVLWQGSASYSNATPNESIASILTNGALPK